MEIEIFLTPFLDYQEKWIFLYVGKFECLSGQQSLNSNFFHYLKKNLENRLFVKDVSVAQCGEFLKMGFGDCFC